MNSSNIKFLLVDDLEENLYALRALLQREGLSLLTAKSGSAALEMLLQHDVALAIIDVQMPGMDGFELAELMRGTERTRRVPIIFVTAGAVDMKRRFDGYEKGAVDFLFKPIEPHILQSKCDVFFELAKERQQLAANRDELRALAEQNARLARETQQKADALAESESRFRAMANGTPVVIWVHDERGQLQFVNKAWNNFFGRTIEQGHGERWQPLVHPDDAAAYVDVFLDCVAEKKPFRAQARVLRHDGQWRWIASYGQPCFSPAGAFSGMAGSSIDITEQKLLEEELERLVGERTQQLRETNEQLNAFCYSIAHDLNAPLRAQMAFASILETEYAQALGDSGCDMVRRIGAAARKQSKLVQDLLSHMGISRSELPLQPVELGFAVREARQELREEAQAKEAKFELLELNHHVQANPASLHLVLVNLISNAIKFVAKDTRPIVRIKAERCSKVNASGEKRPFVRLTVQDNGIGIPEEYLGKLFGVFQRLHTSHGYPGTGIGLAVVKVAVERMGGKVGLESEAGKGSAFWVDLPEAGPVPDVAALPVCEETPAFNAATPA